MKDIIFCDVDGCIAKFIDGFGSWIKEKNGTIIDESDYNLGFKDGHEYYALINEYFAENVHKMDHYDGAKENFNIVVESLCDIVIATKIPQKLAQLRLNNLDGYNFGGSNFTYGNLTKREELEMRYSSLSGYNKIIIEDAPDSVIEFIKHGWTVIVPIFHPYTKKFGSFDTSEYNGKIVTFRNWHEIPNIVEKLLA